MKEIYGNTLVSSDGRREASDLQPGSLHPGSLQLGSVPILTLFDISCVSEGLERWTDLPVSTGPATTKTEFTLLAARAVRQKCLGVSSFNTIVPGHLYLGGGGDARNRHLLTSLGVTDVISMANLDDEKIQDFRDSPIIFRRITLPDCLGVPLIAQLRSTLHALNDESFEGKPPPHLTLQDICPEKQFSEQMKQSSQQINQFNEQIGNQRLDRKMAIEPNTPTLFVHCQQGISRSTTFVIFYLMYSLFLSYPVKQSEGETERDTQTERDIQTERHTQTEGDTQTETAAVAVEDMVTPEKILSRVRRGRQVCPNVTFLSQLRLIHEVLKVLVDVPFAQYKELDSVVKRRQFVFDLAVRFCEAYIEYDSRCIAETFSYMNGSVIGSLMRRAETTLALGLTAWAMKKSAARDSLQWIGDGVTLENFLVYSQQMPSLSSIICMSSKSDDECYTFDEVNAAVDRRWSNHSDAEFNTLPQFAGFLHSEHDALDQNNFGPQHRFVRPQSTITLTGVDLTPITKSFTVPTSLFLNLKTQADKHAWVCQALGVHQDQHLGMERDTALPHKNGEETTNELRETADRDRETAVVHADKTKNGVQTRWRSKRLLQESIKEADLCATVLHDLFERFGCKNYAMWTIDRVSTQVTKFKEAVEKWRATMTNGGYNPPRDMTAHVPKLSSVSDSEGTKPICERDMERRDREERDGETRERKGRRRKDSSDREKRHRSDASWDAGGANAPVSDEQRDGRGTRRHRDDTRTHGNDTWRHGEDTRKHGDDTRRRQRDTRRHEEDTRRRDESPRRYGGTGRREEHTRRREEHTRRRENDTRRHDDVIRRREDEARRREDETRRHEEEDKRRRRDTYPEERWRDQGQADERWRKPQSERRDRSRDEERAQSPSQKRSRHNI